MALETPVIDDRSYEDLLGEIRARIPRYTSEWTDLNDNEPGMILAQLFAWLTDMLIYRLGRVPELNRIKFLELVGFELRPAEPAIAQITFPVKDSAADPFVIVPLRTQLEAEESDDEGSIVFETESALNAIRARLESVMLEQGQSRTLVTSLNAEPGDPFKPFGAASSVGSALLLGFSEALPSVDLELAIWVEGAGSILAAYRCGQSTHMSFSSPPIVWEYWDGDGWQKLELARDTTEAFTRSGYVRLKTPRTAMAALTLSPETEPYYWVRARLERSVYDSVPQLLAVRTNTVDAKQAETIVDEILGGSDGSPNQTFTLSRAPVLADTMQLEIDEGRTQQVWREEEDLFGCGPSDYCYTLSRAAGEVRFGDGVQFGAIPLGNPRKPRTSIVAREYRVGGGTRGNVLAGKINVLRSSVSDIESGEVSNLFAAAGGSAEETLELLEKRAAHSLRNQDRAVTAEDFEELAKQAADIGRAKALPLFHPWFPDLEVPGVVTVIVVPNRATTSEDPADLDRKPTPGELTLQSVCTYLDERRLLTAELYVVAPTYRKIDIQATIVAEDDADTASVYDTVRSDLLNFLDPLTGGRDGGGWPFGGAVYYSQVLQKIAAVSGVQRVASLSILLDGKTQPDCSDVAIGPNELVYSEPFSELTVQYEEDDA